MTLPWEKIPLPRLCHWRCVLAVPRGSVAMKVPWPCPEHPPDVHERLWQPMYFPDRGIYGSVIIVLVAQLTGIGKTKPMTGPKVLGEGPRMGPIKR